MSIERVKSNLSSALKALVDGKGYSGDFWHFEDEPADYDKVSTEIKRLLQLAATDVVADAQQPRRETSNRVLICQSCRVCELQAYNAIAFGPGIFASDGLSANITLKCELCGSIYSMRFVYPDAQSPPEACLSLQTASGEFMTVWT